MGSRGDTTTDVTSDAAAMHSVAGKVIVVTGSGRGVGRGMAVHLGKGGARVVVAEWKPDLMAETVAELEDLGVEAFGVACNVMDKAEIGAWVPPSVESRSRVGGVVNNAQTF